MIVTIQGEQGELTAVNSDTGAPLSDSVLTRKQIDPFSQAR